MQELHQATRLVYTTAGVMERETERERGCGEEGESAGITLFQATRLVYTIAGVIERERERETAGCGEEGDDVSYGITSG